MSPYVLPLTSITATGPQPSTARRYDGHAGPECADYAVKCLHTNIVGAFRYTAGDAAAPGEAGSGGGEGDSAAAADQMQAECELYTAQLQQLEALLALDPGNAELAATRDQLAELLALLQGQLAE